MPEVSGIMTLFPTWASREQIPFLLAWSVCLSRTCLKWEWLVSRREELLNLKAPFHLDFHQVSFLSLCQTSTPCLPSSGMTGLSLFIHNRDYLAKWGAQQNGGKQREVASCLPSFHLTEKKFLFLIDGKQNQNPRPHHQKSRGCKFSDSNRAVLHYIKIDLWHPRVQDNSWKHTQSQEKWLYNAIWAFHILFSLSLCLSLS